MIRVLLFPLVAFASAGARNPYDRQVAERPESLRSRSPSARAHAAEALGFLRAYQAEEALVGALDDPARRRFGETPLWPSDGAAAGRPSPRCSSGSTTLTGPSPRPPRSP